VTSQEIGGLFEKLSNQSGYPQNWFPNATADRSTELYFSPAAAITPWVTRF
jgi:hypothetical protein